MGNNIVSTIKLKTKKERSTREIEMSVYNDGAVSFSTDLAETFVYLYPDVVAKVRRKLNAMAKEVVTSSQSKGEQ